MSDPTDDTPPQDDTPKPSEEAAAGDGESSPPDDPQPDDPQPDDPEPDDPEPDDAGDDPEPDDDGGDDDGDDPDPDTMDNSAVDNAGTQDVGSIQQACRLIWELVVTATSKEPKDPIWPTDKITLSANLTAGAGAIVPLPLGVDVDSAGGGSRSMALIMTSATTLPLNLGGLFDSTFQLTIDDLPTLWHLVEQKTEVLKPGDNRTSQLEINRDRLVWLQMVWTDPEAKERFIPKDFPVTVTFDDASTLALKVDTEGKLSFSHSRDRTWFSLSYPTTAQFIASKRGEAPSATTEFLMTKDDLDPFINNRRSVTDPPANASVSPERFNFYQVPAAEWTMKQSDWAVTADGGHWAAPDQRFNVSASDDVATKAAPAKLTLDPHWQFLRFEFFDRYFGHSDHGDARVGVPPLTLQGQRSTVASGAPVPTAARGALSPVDTCSNWNVQTDDGAKSCSCLPWILQKAADGSDDPQPRAGAVMQLVTDAGTFLSSKDATTRLLKTALAADALKPSAERLKLYDLPALWKSPGWWVRKPDTPVAGGKLIKDLTDGELKAPTHASRLIFSLDDLVLTDASRHQVTLADTERVAVFHNSFSDPGEAGNASKVGVYKHDAGAEESFFSKVEPDQRQYIVDYPNWSRVVVAQGNIFDAFAERVPDEDPNAVVGARAAVAWVNSPPISAAGTALPIASRPARTDKTFFSIQPFFDQRYAQTNVKYTGPGVNKTTIGRFDMTTLRCCGHDGDSELIANMHYFRLFYDFSAITTGGLTGAGGQKTYKEETANNLIARFNGNDARNGTRMELRPQDAAKQIKGQIFYFVQPVAAAAGAHFSVKMAPAAAGGRNWMSGFNGTGEFGERSNVPENQYGGAGSGSYTAAHELGHGGSLPDEYNERWGAQSFSEASIRANTPGDAYEDDATNWDTLSATTAANTNSALMTGVVTQRNRYFWHSAEFARLVTTIPFTVKYGVFDKYKVPPHPQAPNQSYVWWPFRDAVDTTQGGRGKFDVLLFPLGHEFYSDSALAGGPYDGIIVVVVKLRLNMPGADADAVTQRLTAIRNRIKSDLNGAGGKFHANGSVTGADAPGPFSKVYIKFSPRFLVFDGTNAADTFQPDGVTLITNGTTNITAWSGIHFAIDFNDLSAATPKPADSTTWQANGNLMVNIDLGAATAATNLAQLVSAAFLEMIGKDRPSGLSVIWNFFAGEPPWVFDASDTEKLVRKVLPGGHASL